MGAGRPDAVERSAASPRHRTYNYSPEKNAQLKRMARVEGQVRGVSRMIEEDRRCIDTVTQVAAVTRALQAVSLSLLEQDLARCAAQAAATGEEATAKVREISEAMARIVRL